MALALPLPIIHPASVPLQMAEKMDDFWMNHIQYIVQNQSGKNFVLVCPGEVGCNVQGCNIKGTLEKKRKCATGGQWRIARARDRHVLSCWTVSSSSVNTQVSE